MYFNKIINKALQYRFVRFLMGGAVGSAVYMILFYGLTEWLSFVYLISSIIGSVVGNAINFVIQKFWTFNDYDIKNASWQGFLFLAKDLFLSAFNIFSLWLIVEKLHINYLIAQVLIMPVTTILSFAFSKGIFKNKKPE